VNRLDFFGCGLLLMSLLIGVIGYGKIQSNTEDVIEWLPDESAARKDLQQFEQWFGSDDYLVITWEDCTLEDPRIEKLRQAILGADEEDLIENVVSGPSVMRALTERYRMSRIEVVRRLQGVFFGRKQPALTCLNVELSALGAANRKQSMQLVHGAISTVAGLSMDEVAIGGYPFIATTIDRQLHDSLRYLLVPSILLATLVSFLCLRDWALLGIVFTTALSAALVSLTIIPLVGVKFGGLMSIIPALVFVLATSGCIHLIRYSLTVGNFPRKIWAIGWLPCTVSAMSTVVGMMALTGSQFPAIRKFGLFCAVGVVVGWVFQLVIVPWLLHRIGKSGMERLAARQSRSRFWNNWHQALVRHKFIFAFVSLSLFFSLAFGLRHLRAEVEVENLFRANSPVMVSLRKLEDQLGPLDQTELLLVFGNVDSEQFDERVRHVKAIQNALTDIEDVQFAHSLINYLPSEPVVTDARSLVRRSMYRSRLRNEREAMSNGRNLVVAGRQEVWRISLRFPFTANHDWEDLGLKVKDVTQQMIREFSQQTPGLEIDLIYTGRANLFQHAQKNLLRDLFRNFLLAFTVITPILVLALRSLAIGLLAMLPNLFPAVVLFGGLGFAGYPVDLAIAMTACIALGIAVDDTTHFLVRYRDQGGSLKNATDPIRLVVGQCGPAMLHTTLIACGGLLMYALGEMLVVARFSIMISLLLFFALVADLIMMPSILLSLESMKKSKRVIDQPDTA
jgi:predicted RND superfamily exporter protein